MRTYFTVLAENHRFLTRQAVGLPATFQAVGGGIKLPPLYIFQNISGMRRDSDAKFCMRQDEYLAHVYSKFCVFTFLNDVTVTSQNNFVTRVLAFSFVS